MNAEELLNELQGNYLEVVLVPAPDQRHEGHCVRAVQYPNADWYRRFCLMYPSDSKRRSSRKSWTRIKRRETENALKKILQGETKGVYVERILEFLEREVANKNQDIPF